jgi:hypothetical protein
MKGVISGDLVLILIETNSQNGKELGMNTDGEFKLDSTNHNLYYIPRDGNYNLRFQPNPIPSHEPSVNAVYLVLEKKQPTNCLIISSKYHLYDIYLRLLYICIMILKYTRGRNVTKYKYFFFFFKKEIKNYLIK